MSKIGRPKGSKNKPKIVSETEVQSTEIPTSTVSNESNEINVQSQISGAPALRVRKGGNLKASFELKDQQSKPQEVANSQENFSSVVPQIDYDSALNAFWGTVDSFIGLIAFASRGKIEYIPLSKDEIKKLTDSTKNNSFMQKISTVGSLSSFFMIGTIAFIFKDKVKIKTEIKHDDKNKDCKCKKCKKVIEKIKEDIVEEVKNDEVKEKSINESESSSNEVMIDNSSEFTNTNGVIIQENNFTPVSEQQVLEQNTEKRFEF